MEIKKLIYPILMLVPVLLGSCNDDDVVVMEPTAQGTVVDDMGNNYDWVRIGDLEWTTSNALNGPLCSDATFEGNWGPEYVFSSSMAAYMEEEYIPQYGNLMNYADAVASAPDGWRLPTDEDWKNLERALGMKDADNIGWRGAGGVSSRLMEKGTGSKMGLMLGGGILRIQDYGQLKLTFEYFKEFGYFWTSTDCTEPESESKAYFRKLVFGVDGVERRGGSTEYLLSVRWCRNATN